jgi:hypothetical protein
MDSLPRLDEGRGVKFSGFDLPMSLTNLGFTSAQVALGGNAGVARADGSEETVRVNDCDRRIKRAPGYLRSHELTGRRLGFVLPLGRGNRLGGELQRVAWPKRDKGARLILADSSEERDAGRGRYLAGKMDDHHVRLKVSQLGLLERGERPVSGRRELGKAKRRKEQESEILHIRANLPSRGAIVTQVSDDLQGF